MRRHNKDFFLFKEERKGYEKMKRKMERKTSSFRNPEGTVSCLTVPYGFRKVHQCEIQVRNRP